jgi:hypothetical protein
MFGHNRSCGLVGIVGCAGLALGLPALAQQADIPQQLGVSAPIGQPEQAVRKDTGRRGVLAHAPGLREVFGDPELAFVVANSGMVLDATLESKRTYQPNGMRVLVTEYTFRVNEMFKGAAARGRVTVTEIGGEDPNNPAGGGMTTCRSHRLEVNGRYVLFLTPDALTGQYPFNKVLQITAEGRITDDAGRVVTGVVNGMIRTRSNAEGRSLAYFKNARHNQPQEQRVLAPLPVATLGEVIPVEQPVVSNDPMPVQELLRLLRPAGAPAALPGPIGLPLVDPLDYLRCGHLTSSMNFRYLMPDNNNFSWTQNAMIDWNNVVGAGGNSTWIYGNILSGGLPIRNQNPVANNNQNNCGTTTNAQMVAGGYGSWPAANGICFRWYDSSCGRINETDVFANSTIQADELQFRKTMVHELGHALGLNHEDRYVAIMVSGTWRVPPNYSSNTYSRGDETLGGRASMNAGNGQTAGSWVLDSSWRDISTVSQAHPNWGTSGDVGTNMTRLSDYSVTGGQAGVQLQRVFIENRGATSFSGPVTLRVYLSTNNIISSGDTEVAELTYATYPAFGFNNNFNIGLAIPTSLPSGDYYVGWILSSGLSELETANNTGILMGDASTSFQELQVSVTNTAPSNNTCASARVVSLGSYTGTTTNATNDTSGTCGLTTTSPDVWYSFTAPCSGTLRIDTCGSWAATPAFDTVVSVYSSCGGTVLDCQDDNTGCGLRDTIINLPVTAGTNYKIRVAGYNGSTGNFNLNLSMPAPANNACANAIVVGNGTTPFGTCGATTDGPNEPGACNFFSYTHIDNDVWYRYTATCTGTVDIALCDANYDSKIAVYGGSCPTGSGQLLVCNDDSCGLRSQVSFHAVQGQQYRIRIGGYNGARGSGNMVIACSPVNWTTLTLPPFGNTFSDATRTRGMWFTAPTSFTISGVRVPDETNFGLQNVEILRLAVEPPLFPANLGTGNFTSLGRWIAVPSASVIPTDILINSGDIIGVLGACGDATIMHNSYAAVSTFVTNIFGQPMTLRRFGMQYNLVTTPAQEVWTENANIARVELYYTAGGCYANCDGSTISPILNVGDFTCFLQRFAAGDSYANCDNSTVPPVLNVGDFTCFLQRFAQGCP